jgi:dihydroorotase
MTTLQRITITRPDDWHLHVRDGAMLRVVLPYTAAVFGRAIIMPNLQPPVATAARAAAYRDEILAALPAGASFTPLMTCYLTNDTDANDLAAGHTQGIFTAAKLYPANATTNSAHGVTDIKKINPVLARMEKIGMPLLVHGEVTDPEIDIFDREKVFIDRILTDILRSFPALKVVFEHVTTAEAVDFVRSHAASKRLGATITAHHLHINRNAIFTGGIRPHFYCLPVAKREQHRLKLIDAATSGEAAFFLGTDSAPHPVGAKESACGCAGIFTAPDALPLYAQIFADAGKLDRLEGFASLHGAAFYGLPVNQGKVTLVEQPAAASAAGRIKLVDQGELQPFDAPKPLKWKVVS